MAEIVSAVLLVIGTVFVLIGAIGVVRLPDLFTRMQATSKTATLGLAFILLGVAAYFGDLPIVTRAIAVIVFAFMTTPVGAQMIARAAYFSGVPLWETRINELAGQYDSETHELRSPKD